MTTFIDTSYVLALVNTKDHYHPLAEELAQRVRDKLVITEAILVEIGNSLSRLQWRSLAVATLHAIVEDPNIEVVPVDSALIERALKFYTERVDKEWSMTDCISFLVMLDKGIDNALAADKHFQQAGFRALMLET